MEHQSEPTAELSAEFSADAPAAAFDLIARQDAADAELTALRGELTEVKSQLARHGRAAARPPLAGAERAPASRSFIDGYLRTGRDTEVKAITDTSGPSGGYLVPTELDARIAEVLLRISPIRAVAQVVQTSTSDYRKLVSLSNTASGWVSETAPRPETTEPTFTQIIPPSGDLYAAPAASQHMLDDAMFDLEGWLAGEIAREFARAEGAAFVSGNGNNQPAGFLTAPKSNVPDNGGRPFGTIQYIPSGSATGWDTAPDLHLIDMVMSLNPGHRQGAVWVMNASTLSTIRKLKDSVGDYLWQPGIMDKAPDRLLGYPVIEAADMPSVGAGVSPIAFGNFQNGYIITERYGTRILRDPYTNKPFVNFYATRRIGGQVLDSNAIKLLTIAAS